MIRVGLVKISALQFFLFFLVLFQTSVVVGQLKLPRVFSDNMVIQQELPIVVWGWAKPEQEVAVSFVNRNAKTKADKNGKWKVTLEPLKADGKQHTFTVESDGKNIRLQNVVLGEVWLCAGQSNMNRGTDIRKENRSDIRLMWIDGSTTPKKDDLGEKVAGWVPCTPEGLASAKPAVIRNREQPRTQFAEVGYVFGRKIHEELDVPVGLIKAAFGGSQVEAWTPKVGIEDELPFDKKVERSYVGHTPGLLYQSMIHGMVPFSIRGVVWYQGENNGRDRQYHLHMKAWIESWRELWGREDLPFYFVQIAPTSYAGGNMQQLWEAQTWVMNHVPNTGMAVSNDIYLHGKLKPEEVISEQGKLTRSPSNPHPPNKHIVGERAANIALVKTYGIPERVLFGPMLDSYRMDGDKIHIRFKHVGDGLKTRDGKEPNWFYVSPELPAKEKIFNLDHRYRRLQKYLQPARAEITGKDTVTIHVPKEVKDPKVVLFAWDCIAIHNLTNSAGLPGVSFRIELDPEVAKKLELKSAFGSRRDFQVDGRNAFVIMPTASNRNQSIPWVWYAPTFHKKLPQQAEDWMFDRYLKAGIAIAGMDVGESYGSPKGTKAYQALYRELVEKHRFGKRPVLLARSRGGLMLYSWAIENPDCVGGIAGIYPVCNLKSYPGLKNAASAFELSEEQLGERISEFNPIDRLESLAKARVPLHHIHGDSDRVVPLEANSAMLAERYRKLGGSVYVEIVKGKGHDMWPGWFQSKPLADFVIRNALKANRPENNNK